ncbi:hypothetical protein BOO71_0009121 [Deinococcus marmoris]|uniref:Uncharacterized protein n=1 Tax=Deinococcus marmoris TaxID=249408 RepID=A0A1U7NWN4_9DEIO|nr:hypothetical protein BOO71_0009121 [Deinococcus marmoris]
MELLGEGGADRVWPFKLWIRSQIANQKTPLPGGASAMPRKWLSRRTGQRRGTVVWPELCGPELRGSSGKAVPLVARTTCLATPPESMLRLPDGACCQAVGAVRWML